MIKESQITGMVRSHNFKDKERVAKFLKNSFSNLKDKERGWEILRNLANDSNQYVKLSSIDAIRLSFVYISNKEDAWQCLLNLAQESNKKIQLNASVTLPKVFTHHPDKERAWMDLLETVKSSVKVSNLYPLVILSDCFECFDDKDRIVDSLRQLADSGDIFLSSYSNNLIGRIYISKSVKAKSDEFNKLYFEGINYLKKSFDELNVPSHKFCYIMHNIFSKIIEGELKNATEINNGIDELKIISEKSNEKQKIVKILDELYNILEETLEAQKNGEDISRFKEKIIPICIQLNMLIGTLDNEVVRLIAEKAQERIYFEYKCTIKALEIVDYLIESPNKLISEPDLLIETIQLCCISISEPLCNHYKSKLEEIEKENVMNKKQEQLLDLIQDLKPILEQEKSLKEIIVSGQSEIKNEIVKLGEYFISINHKGPRQEITISTGLEMLGTGAKVITTIPLNEIKYKEIEDDIAKIKNKMRLIEIPKQLKERIIEYLSTCSTK